MTNSQTKGSNEMDTKRLTYKRMFKWVSSYSVISGFRNKEWVNKEELQECFTNLLKSKNLSDILRANFSNLRLENNKYIYDVPVIEVDIKSEQL